MYNIGHTTFTFERDLTIIKVKMLTKNEVAASKHSRVIMLTDR